MKYEALDRIHVVRTLLDTILMDVTYDVKNPHHSGLSKKAIKHLNKAHKHLYEAYQAQGEHAFEEEE